MTDHERAWNLNEQTGWPFPECLRLVRKYSEDQLDDYIEDQALVELGDVAELERRLARTNEAITNCRAFLQALKEP